MTGATLKPPVLTILPSKSNFDVGDPLLIDCSAPFPMCAKAEFRIYRKGNFYTREEGGHSSVGLISRTIAATDKAGGYSCDYIYTAGNGHPSPRSNTVYIAVTKYILGFIPSTYT